MNVAALERFRPMLAEHPEAKHSLVFPMIAFPKYDGIRCVLHPTKGPSTRSLKPLMNRPIREALSHLPDGLDGELLVGDPADRKVFAKTGVLRSISDPAPATIYFVTFDNFLVPDMGYRARLMGLEILHKAYINEDPDDNAEVIKGSSFNLEWIVSSYREVHSGEEVDAYYDECIAAGYEGLILRNPIARYKFGRSTAKEQGMIKMKPFEDAEAEIIGYEPLLRNQNEPTRDAMGLQKRSSHKDNKVPDALLGKLLVRGVNGPYAGIEFAIGSGFDVALRQKIWNSRPDHLGSLVTYTYQPHGSVDKPRCPIYKGFRSKDDMS